VAAPVELIDLFPTLRELVAPATEVPGLEGASLFSGGRHAFSEAGQRRKHHYRSVQEGRFKLIYDPDPDDLARRVALASAWQLYDLDADPGETANLLLAAAPADDLRRLRAALLAWAKQPPAAAGDDEAAAARDREVRKALRALGYVQ
jgi:arylsulfatase A-like enzyme